MKGVVAFFDILGYQNIIDNNEIEKVSKIITDILKVAPSKSKDSLRSISKDETKKKIINNALSSIDTILISDSLLSHFEFDVDGADDSNNLELILFIGYLSQLTRMLFVEGLPIRGSICFGDFFVDEQCIAGKPIIDAYRLSESLDFSGVVICEKTYEKIKKPFTGNTLNIVSNHFIEYLVPTKSGDVKMYLMNWFGKTKVPTDIGQYVYESFRNHNKEIPDSVINKMKNTELTLREFIRIKNKNKSKSKPKKVQPKKIAEQGNREVREKAGEI